MSKNNKKKIKIGVIFGGRSGEHEVSIVSAESVIKAIDKSKYEVVPIGITKKGQWIAGPDAVKFLKSGLKKLPFKSVLTTDPTDKRIVNVSQTSLAPVDKPSLAKIDVIFPVLHGTYGEDGSIQGMLELANIAYVGSGVLGSALAMDKVVSKNIFKEAGFLVVPFTWFLSQEWEQNKQQVIRKVEKVLKYPVFVKPANLGSSVGISKVKNKVELIQAVQEAMAYDNKIIVEQGINNIREIEIAVLGNDKPGASVPGEIIPSNEFYDYAAKYIDGKSQEKIPADLPPVVIKKIQTLAVEAFKVLNLSGLARIDFLVEKKSNTVYINEANTIPGFTSISMYPKLWEKSGLSYTKLIDKLIALAIQKHKIKNRLKREFQPSQDWYK